jgi:hypothetical protein
MYLNVVAIRLYVLIFALWNTNQKDAIEPMDCLRTQDQWAAQAAQKPTETYLSGTQVIKKLRSKRRTCHLALLSILLYEGHN